MVFDYKKISKNAKIGDYSRNLSPSEPTNNGDFVNPVLQP